ncbi:MAG: DUF5615 family PIN-like protein [Acidobacteriota bacterium]|nr:DUF5615 family PIN-like protein [Acidobacteriota bacterium]
MRLLLDELYSKEIAVQLRTLGHDVVAVSELDLDGTKDPALLTVAATERRALVTNNARDFVPIASRWLASGREHSGLLLTFDRGLPRDRREIGRHVRTLALALDANPDDDALLNQIRWLSPPED